MKHIILTTLLLRASTVLGSRDDVKLELGATPLDVAGIVAAISNVQKNVTDAPSFFPNIMVATSTGVNLPDTSTTATSVKSPSTEAPTSAPLMKLTLARDDTNGTTVVTTVAPTTLGTADAEELETTTEMEDLNTTTTINPIHLPDTGIFSTQGFDRWRSWVSAMRDPEVNPDGVAWWPEILTTGTQRLMHIYNPFRGFGSRALKATKSASDLLTVYEHRDAIIEALETNKVEPSLNSILKYTHELEKKEFADKLTNIINRNGTVDDAKVGKQAEQETNSNDVSNDANKNLVVGPATAPFDVSLVNFVLKSLYVLAALLYIPFSGIDNFFTAPLPPEMDSLSGQLRFFGLQALLGPDYVVDYDPPASEEEAEYEYEYEYVDEEVRRADLGKAKKKSTKKSSKPGAKKQQSKKPSKETTYYNTVNSEVRAPPSRYGEAPPGAPPKTYSSYSSYKHEPMELS